MYWNEAIECASRDLLDSIQLRKLKATVKRMYTYVEPYRNKMQETGVLPEDIRTLDDIRKLPFCT